MFGSSSSSPLASARAHQYQLGGDKFSFQESLFGRDFVAPPRPDGVPFKRLYSTLTSPYFPIIFGAIYFVTAKYLSAKQNGKNRLQGSKIADWAVLAHNVFLAAYSAWTFIGTAPVILGAFYKGYVANGVAGLTHAFCDSAFTVWSQTEFPRFAYLFYLSKFYEIIDTAILLAKGKKVGMLQSYHHAGAMITMHAGYTASAMPIWIFVVFNSFIHSAMYCYYAFTTLRLPFPKVLKRNLTRLQITQFLIGGSLAASYLFITLPDLPSSSRLAASSSQQIDTFNFSSQLRGATKTAAQRLGGDQCLVNGAQRQAVLMNVFYLLPLTYLFVAFFIKSYKKQQNVAPSDKTAARVAAHDAVKATSAKAQ